MTENKERAKLIIIDVEIGNTPDNEIAEKLKLLIPTDDEIKELEEDCNVRFMWMPKRGGYCNNVSIA